MIADLDDHLRPASPVKIVSAVHPAVFDSWASGGFHVSQPCAADGAGVLLTLAAVAVVASIGTYLTAPRLSAMAPASTA